MKLLRGSEPAVSRPASKPAVKSTNKPARVLARSAPTKNTVEGIRQFLYDTRAEVRKVIWPTREQATNLTILVITVSVIIGAFLGMIDLLVRKVFELLLGGA